jgi:hypothetical protein
VSAKALVFVSVIVSVEAIVSPTLEGENACDRVGGEGVTESEVGQGDEPALVGALVEALDAVSVTTAVSVAPSESVTVRVNVPVPGSTVTLAAEPPETIDTPPEALQA